VRFSSEDVRGRTLDTYCHIAAVGFTLPIGSLRGGEATGEKTRAVELRAVKSLRRATEGTPVMECARTSTPHEATSIAIDP
jgi:hypothetical protein